MGRSIYFTDQEIEKLIDYTTNSVEVLGEAECTHEQTDEDMENGLGSAIRKLYKGRNGERPEKLSFLTELTSNTSMDFWLVEIRKKVAFNGLGHRKLRSITRADECKCVGSI